MNREKKICFIINPVAGGKRKGKFVEYLKNLNQEINSPQIFYSSYPGHSFEIAESELNKGAEIIVAVGGDGTINEIARALTGSDCSLGIIPFGSGNGFARHFKIPLDYKKALGLIYSGKEILIDTARVNEKEFFCTSGIGFDAEIGHLFAHFKHRGFISYGISFLKAFKNYKSQNYKLIIDENTVLSDAFLVNIANISQFGSNFYIAPQASATDGFLNLVILKKFPKWKVIPLIFRSYFRTIHKSSYIEEKNIKKLTIQSGSMKKKIHIDGEPETLKGDLRYTIVPESLKLIR